MADQSFSRWRPHPWHGLSAGDDAPRVVNVFVEITPFDLIKYEVDKSSGYLKVDRPQRTSSQPPTLYGFVPQTYCAERVTRLSPGARRTISSTTSTIAGVVVFSESSSRGGSSSFWSVLVALGLAQPLVDFITYLHMVSNPYTISEFNLSLAIGLIVITGVVGYVFGWIFSYICNWAHS